MRNTVTKTSSAGKPISFLRDEKVDVGVDVHKSSYSVTMGSEARQGYVSHWVQPADPAALIQRLMPCNGQEAKSDRLDSRRLAMWSAKGLLHPVRIPTEEEEADRQIFRVLSASMHEFA